MLRQRSALTFRAAAFKRRQAACERLAERRVVPPSNEFWTLGDGLIEQLGTGLFCSIFEHLGTGLICPIFEQNKPVPNCSKHSHVGGREPVKLNSQNALV